MASDSLIIARRQLAHGVGQTTRKNRVLPFAPLAVQIPARVGIFDPGAPAAPVLDPPPCLQGEIRSTSVSASWYVAWHAAEPPLLSSDAVWAIDPTPWKRWSGYTNDGSPSLGTLVHFNFSSPTTAAALDPAGAGTHVQMVESPWATRTWYAKREAVIPHAGLLACVQRLKSATFTQDGVSPPYSFTWTFSNDGDPTDDAATPACINRTGHETGLDTRVHTFPSTPTAMSAYQRILSFGMLFAGFKTAVQSTRADGFLPAFRHPSFVAYAADVDLVASDPPNLLCTDLAKFLSVGQPWHGLCTPTAIERPGFSPTTPAAYIKPANTNTRYFKAISPPGAPDAALLPPGFDANGYQFLDDVVLRAGTDYTPKRATRLNTIPQSVAANEWLHCDDTGVVRKMSISPLTPTADRTRFRFKDLGPPTLGRSPLDIDKGLFDVVTTDPSALAVYSAGSGLRRFASSQPDYQVSAVNAGGIVSPNLRLAVSHPVAASPNGRQVALLTGAYYASAGGSNIYTVATFDIDSDRNVTGPNYVFQYEEQKPTDAVTEHYWSTYYGHIQTGEHPNWWAYGTKYTRTVATPKVQTTCHAVCYDNAGNLHLFLRRIHKFEDGGPFLGPSPNTFTYDSGIPLTAPQPDPSTTTPADGAVTQTDVYPDLTYANFASGTAWMDEFGIPEITAVALITSIYRIANNVICANISITGSGTTQQIATPSGHATVATVWPTYSTYEKWASWNPRTGELAGRNNTAGTNTGAISWI